MDNVEKMLGEYRRWGENLKKGFELGDIGLKPIDSIIIGMGGSGVVGHILKEILESLGRRVSVEVYNHPYPNPKRLRKKRLVLISHSGNTDEVLEAGETLSQYALDTVVITGGGKLKELGEELGWTLIQVAKSPLPRLGLPQMLGAALAIFKAYSRDKIEKTAARLDRYTSSKAVERESRKIAKWLFGKHIVVMHPPHASSIGLRFTQMIAENAKSFAKPVMYPELSHNYIEYLDSLQPLFGVYMFYDGSKYGYGLLKVLTKKTLSIFRRDFNPRGDKVYRYLAEVALHDMATIRLAALKRVDPMDTPVIREYKGLVKGE